MALAERTPARRRVLLASDRDDHSEDLAVILANLGDVEQISTQAMPDNPSGRYTGVVVDIDLTSVNSVQAVRRKLTARSYQSLPRLFVLAEGIRLESIQAWSLGATDTIRWPFDAEDILQRVRASFPDSPEDTTSKTQTLNAGVAAANVVMTKIFERLPAGTPLTLDDVMQAELKILRALRRTSLREWLMAINKHHNRTYRHCLLVTGYTAAFAQHLGMREDDQRRLTRAALIHDVGKAYIPLAILDKTTALTPREEIELSKHSQIGFDVLKSHGEFSREMLDVVLHHHEMLDGSGYPDGLKGQEIADLVRMITIADMFAMMVEDRPDSPPMSNAAAFTVIESLTGKLDMDVVRAFRPVAFGA
ncbi:MAG TPA: HD domain-containing phosphohydrolase [Afipia sp.]